MQYLLPKGLPFLRRSYQANFMNPQFLEFIGRCLSVLHKKKNIVRYEISYKHVDIAAVFISF